MLAHAIVSSVLKNETVVEDPEDVHGILELCQVLIREQPDAVPLPPGTGGRRGTFGGSEREDVAEEQGWIARMVHLFRSESLGTQFEVRTRSLTEFLEFSPIC
jgi:vacuolar protein sorting-associated protein 35